MAIETALVARIQRGDDRGFRQLFDRYAPGVRRLSRDLLRDPAAAEEATQETFVRLFRGLGRLENGRKLASWIFGIARNVCREELRSRRRADAPASAPPPAQAAPAPSPREVLLRHEADVVLADALTHLSEGRRAALLMRIDHDLGYGDIAEAMGWTRAMVKNEIHRGRLELRAALASYLGEPR